MTFPSAPRSRQSAGMLITPMSSIDPNMGVPWLVNAFMLVLVSAYPFGTLVISCLVLGGAQVLVSSYVNPVLGRSDHRGARRHHPAHQAERLCL